MMHTYTTVQLIVQTNFLVCFILVACELNAVHAQVGMHGIFAAGW